MFLQDLAKGLLRRWYLTVIGLLVTLCGAYMVYGVVPLTYKATASVVLVPPATAVVEGENPYLYMGGLDQAMSVLVVKMNSEAVSATLIKDNPGTTYALDRDVTTTGPIMLVTVESTSEAITLQVVDKVLNVIPTNLKALQDQLAIPKTSRITSMNIASDEQAAAQNKNRIRMTLTVAAAGGAATVLLTGLLDRLVMSRKRRRKQRAKKRNRPGGGGNRKEGTQLASQARRSIVGPKTLTDGGGHGLAPHLAPSDVVLETGTGALGPGPGKALARKN